MPNLKRLHAIVSGRVQGVFFRAFTRDIARQLGLKGFCRNLDGGNVEVVAEGSEIDLKKLLAKLNEGPPASHVEKVEIEWLEAKNEFKSFDVRY